MPSRLQVPDVAIETLAIDTIRLLAADAVQQAASGHPGMPMGAAPMAYTLWTRHLRFDPAHPQWPDRDRFVLSAGHGSMLLYALLHLCGFELTLDDLRAFRQWGSRTPGHPEYGETPGVETTTGPLGQGFTNAVGMALAQEHLGALFRDENGPVLQHRTWVIASDGDLMEGVSGEAASLAGHLGLANLVVLWDDNRITIDGDADLAFSEDVAARFRAYGWRTLRVEDGNDVEAIDVALRAARDDAGAPTLIAVRTRIGFGSPAKEGKASAHGEPLGAEELAATKRNLGWPDDAFFVVPDAVRDHFAGVAARGASARLQWQQRMDTWRQRQPQAAAELQRRLSRELPDGWDAQLPRFEPGKSIATRAASGKVLNALAKTLPELIGGSADLSPSNKTIIDGSPNFSASERTGRNLRFGVREHAMAGMLNGLALHGGVRPYGGTFLIFSDYMRPSIRLAALMKQPVIYVFTHDSLAVGEDGPTHQPIEQLAALRAIPGLVVLRPADANETSEAWKVALRERGPVALVLTRQDLPVLAGVELAEGVERGAYVRVDCAGPPELLLLASGSEVQLVAQVATHLQGEGVRARAVSMPSWELFARQPADYRDAVLPPAVSRRLAVEAGTTFGWCRWVGSGEVIGVDRFGASAPGEVNMARFGFTVERVEAAARQLLARA